MLTSLLRKVLRLAPSLTTEPNPLHTVIRETMPVMGEAEMDRYLCIHERGRR